MKNFKLNILLFLLPIFLPAQEKTISLDYAVKYVIFNSGKANDTLTIGYDKEGKFLWTDYLKIGRSFAQTAFRNSPNMASKDIKTHIIFETETGDFYFMFKGGENTMFLKLRMEDIVPPMSDDALDEEIFLISRKTDTRVELLNDVYYEHEIFDENDAASKIIAVFDQKPSL